MLTILAEAAAGSSFFCTAARVLGYLRTGLALDDNLLGNCGIDDIKYLIFINIFHKVIQIYSLPIQLKCVSLFDRNISGVEQSQVESSMVV